MLTASLFDANINADIFHGWLTQDLIPKLSPGATLVMEFEGKENDPGDRFPPKNAAFHKRSDIEHAVKDAGHDLKFLPPYSPDLNPIEPKWAQAKAIRRKTGKSTDEIFAKQF